MSSNPSSSSNRLPVWILLFVAAVGVPAAVGWAFAEQVAQYRWPALGLAQLSEILILGFGLVAGIWPQLENRWLDRLGDWLDSKVQGRAYEYRKRYLRRLIRRYRAFDLKGLTGQGIHTLELAQVFVELNLAPRPVHQTSTGSIPIVPDELRHSPYPIWDYLNVEQTAGQNLVIIGPSGSGKTTLLKHMTLTLAAWKKRRRRTGVLGQRKLPVLLLLRDHVEAIEANAEFSLVQAIRESLTGWQMQVEPGWFEQQLAEGCCLVMLDSLDQVARPETRQNVVAWVQRQMETYAKNQFIITSRPLGYHGNPLSEVTILEIQPFTDHQVQRFVHNWYLANETLTAQIDDPDLPLIAQEGAEDLLQRLRNKPALSALAVNPLLLTMMAVAHRHSSYLSGRRVELYAEIIELFLSESQQAQGSSLDLSPIQKQRLLQPLAHHMMNRQQWEIAQDDALIIISESLALASPESDGAEFLSMIENSRGLVLEGENGAYRFAHLTFQEYLAAVHIQEEGLESELLVHIEECWWHETIRLYSAGADATSVIAACLAAEQPTLPALTLAVECIKETREVHPALFTRLKTVLAWKIEDQDLEQRRVVTAALLAMRWRRLRQVSEDKYVDDSLITCAEYQLFLDELQAKGRYYQPDHWLHFQFPAGQGWEPVVGVRPADAIAFCEWLTKREADGWRYRLPLANEISKSDELETDSVGYWVTTEKDDPTLAGASAPLHTRETLETWFAHDPDRTGDLDLALDLARDRNLAHALALALDLNRDLDLDLALEGAGALALARDLDLGRALDLALEIGRALDLDLAIDLHRALDLALDLDFVSDLDLALNLAHDLSPDSGRDHAFALDLNRAQVLSHDLERTIDRARKLALDFDLALGHNRTLANNPTQILDRVRGLNAEWPQVAGLLRWYARILALVVAVQLRHLLPEQSSSWAALFIPDNPGSQALEAELRRLVDNYLELYIDYVILEERVEGNLPAFEGIRIVKERRRYGRPCSRIG